MRNTCVQKYNFLPEAQISEYIWCSVTLLFCSAGHIVLSTIPENDGFLKQLLGVVPQKFKPSIPHLVSLTHQNFCTNMQPLPHIK